MLLKNKDILAQYEFLSILYCKFIRCYMRSEPIVTDIIERNIAFYLSEEDINYLLSNNNDDIIFHEQYDFFKTNINSNDEILKHIEKYPYLSINYIKKEDIINGLKNLKNIKKINHNRSKDKEIFIPEKILNIVKYLKKLSSERMLVKNGWAGIYFYMMNIMKWISETFDEKQEDLYQYYLFEDIRKLIINGKKLTNDEKLIRKMGVIMKCSGGNTPSPVIKFGEQFIPPVINEKATEYLLYGKATIRKKVKGEVKIVNYNTMHNNLDCINKIMVTEMTQPNMVFIFRNSAGIITNEGGILSHACIISREYNIPCIVGTKYATKILHDGDRVIMWPDGHITYDDEFKET